MGAWLCHGITLELEGDANDYVGKVGARQAARSNRLPAAGWQLHTAPQSGLPHCACLLRPWRPHRPAAASAAGRTLFLC